MANTNRGAWINFAFSLLPYFAVAWLFQWASREQGVFWQALGALVALRIFFHGIEWIGGIVAWRLYGRRAAIKEMVQSFRREGYPKRRQEHHDFMNYVADLEMDETVPKEQRQALRDLHCMTVGVEKVTILAGMRLHDVMDSALAEYSRSQ